MSKNAVITLVIAFFCACLIIQYCFKSESAIHYIPSDSSAKLNSSNAISTYDKPLLLSNNLEESKPHLMNLHYSLNNPFIERQLSESEFLPNVNFSQDFFQLNNSSLTYLTDESQIIHNYQNINAHQFICPESYPYALNYKLSQTNDVIMGHGYRNACAFSGGHHAFGDLLYGDNQFVDAYGDYERLTAFVPWDSVNGCKEDNFSVLLDKTAHLQKINKIYSHETGIGVGYYTESVGESYIAHNCLNYCQKLQQTYCDKLPKDMYYCENEAISGYYKSSKYLVKNQMEYFCVCKFKSSSVEYGDYYFNQLIDVESIIKYRAQLQDVSCTNKLDLINNP